jgi:hypothetical protein
MSIVSEKSRLVFFDEAMIAEYKNAASLFRYFQKLF